jgi:hypothetical protein
MCTCVYRIVVNLSRTNWFQNKGILQHGCICIAHIVWRLLCGVFVGFACLCWILLENCVRLAVLRVLSVWVSGGIIGEIE